MASVTVSRGNRAISIDEAIQQFDLLFDEYFDIAQPATGVAKLYKSSARSGENVLECGGDCTEDDVCTDSASDAGQKEVLHQIAKQLATLGDKYSKQYENEFVNAETVLTSLFTQASGLEYKTFEGTLESIMGHDSNIAGFMFMMQVSTRVSSQIGNVATRAKAFFRRYISDNYGPAIAESGGVQQFVQQP